MSIPPKKTVYSSSVQLMANAKAETPFETMLDINVCYLDGFLDLPGWALQYYKSGKQNFKKAARYLTKLSKEGKNPFNNYIYINPDASYDEDLDELKQMVASDYGISVDVLTTMVINPNYDELTWIKYKLENYNWDDDNVVIDDITYTIKDYWFDDATTIRVYLIDENENVIEKTVPAYDILDTSGDALVARQYLYIEYEINDKTYVDMSPIPANGTTMNYVYTSKTGATVNYNVPPNHYVAVLPMMPLKEGGDGMGWKGTQLCKRNIPKNSPFRANNINTYIDRQYKILQNFQDQLAELKKEGASAAKIQAMEKKISEKQTFINDLNSFKNDPNYDLTGIKEGNPATVIKDYYSTRATKLYKKAEWYEKSSNYDIYKKYAKKCGTTVESQMCTLYDAQCGFSDQDTDQLREQLYDVYFGFGCPMHAIKNTNIYTQGISAYDSIYPRLEADTEHPYIAQYAKYTRFTDDEIFQADKDGNDYVKKHFAEINKKKYKLKAMKAIAKYCFNYFDQYKGTSSGKNITIVHRQGYNYRATHSWKQYKKEIKSGSYKYRYAYEFNATKAQTIYLQEITYTGKMKAEVESIFKGSIDKDSSEHHKEWYYYQVHYKPVYMVKTYLCQVESDMDDETGVYDKLTGIPIYAKYYKTVKDYTTPSYTEPEYELIDTQKVGAVLTDKPTLNITQKMLYNIKETDKIQTSNIMFANGSISYNVTGYTTYHDDDRGESYQVADHWETKTVTGYCTSKNKITTAIFDKDTVWAPLLEYQYQDLYWDDTYKTSDYGKTYKWSDINVLPPSIRTDIPYTNFTPSLFPEKDSTWIVIKNDDDWEGERIIFKYYHKINQFKYECIRVEDYNIEWVVNPREGGQRKAGSLSCLAPDGNSFLPIMLPITEKLSFQDAVIVYQYAMKSYWSFWIKKVVKVKWGDFLLSIVITGGLALVLAAVDNGAYFEFMSAIGQIFNFFNLDFIFKIFGIENTIFAVIIQIVVQIAIAIVTGGTLNIVIAIANAVLSIVKFCIGRNQQQAAEAYQNQMQLISDKNLELQNLENSWGGGLTLESMVNRVHRFGNITSSSYYASLFEPPITRMDDLIRSMVDLPSIQAQVAYINGV